ncbi:hypothetical protein JOD57_004095 [Geodermatophilus bullaregiensis]|uniref:RGCVC family protein n=1 Tax=Geodermatophilus bullaregiensis TaxID=1564160 RepID=UPI00355716BC|nr:hypothetical protein [Geodermatophilus bullaregiensis]
MPDPTLVNTAVPAESGRRPVAPTALPRLRTDAPSLGGPACDACPHATSDHDAIGLRFCRATLTGAITRGCICRPS